MREPAAGDGVHHRDKEGRTLTLAEWSRLRADPKYRLVADTEHQGVLIRTIWEGLDDGVQVAPMYSTAVRRGTRWRELERIFWPVTLTEAEAAHVLAVEFVLGQET